MTPGWNVIQWRRLALLAASLVLVTAAVFLPVAAFEFVDYDDPTYVRDNPVVLQGLTLGGLRWAATTFETGNWIPLTWLSHMADAQLFGLWAGGHHLTSLVFHLANTLLLFFLLVRLTGCAMPGAFVAGLFAVHPLHVESVAWVAERKDVLSTLFFLLALHAYVSHARRPSWGRWLGALALFALGLAAKPMLVTLPLVLLILDRWPLRRAQFVEKLPYFLLSGAASWVAYLAQSKAGAVMLLDNYSSSFKLAMLRLNATNAVQSYVAYLGKILWPTRLAALYPYPSHDPMHGYKALGAALLLAGLTFVALRAARKAPYLAAGWLWYLVTLLPVIGFLQVGAQGMADRYTYIPSIGLFVAAAWGGRNLLVRWGGRNLAVATGSGAVLALALVAAVQVSHWRDSVALFGHALEVTENNYVAHKNLGMALMRRGRPDEAATRFREALRLDPAYSVARHGLGLALAEQGRHEEALGEYREILRTKPRAADVLNNLGRSLSALGRLEEGDEAYRAAIRAKPGYLDPLCNLGLNLTREGKYAAGMEALAAAMRINPNVHLVLYNMGLNLALQGMEEQGRPYVMRALALRPDFTEARRLLAQMGGADAPRPR